MSPAHLNQRDSEHDYDNIMMLNDSFQSNDSQSSDVIRSKFSRNLMIQNLSSTALATVYLSLFLFFLDWSLVRWNKMMA